MAYEVRLKNKSRDLCWFQQKCKYGKRCRFTHIDETKDDTTTTSIRQQRLEIVNVRRELEQLRALITNNINDDDAVRYVSNNVGDRVRHVKIIRHNMQNNGRITRTENKEDDISEFPPGTDFVDIARNMAKCLKSQHKRVAEMAWEIELLKRRVREIETKNTPSSEVPQPNECSHKDDPKGEHVVVQPKRVRQKHAKDENVKKKRKRPVPTAKKVRRRLSQERKRWFLQTQQKLPVLEPASENQEAAYMANEPEADIKAEENMEENKQKIERMPELAEQTQHDSATTSNINNHQYRAELDEPRTEPEEEQNGDDEEKDVDENPLSYSYYMRITHVSDCRKFGCDGSCKKAQSQTPSDLSEPDAGDDDEEEEEQSNAEDNGCDNNTATGFEAMNAIKRRKVLLQNFAAEYHAHNLTVAKMKEKRRKKEEQMI